MEKKNNNNVLVWSVIVALGGFLFGFDTAVISGVEKQIQELFQLSSLSHGFTISSALIGTITGALIAGRLADLYGRKPVLTVIAMLYIATAIGCALANNVISFIILRFVGGIGIGASSVVGPMYIAEISPARSRGRMTALFQFNVIFGILMAYISNYLLRDAGAEPWRWMLGIAAVPAMLFFLFLFLVPESPRFLIKAGHEEKARMILERIESESIDEEIEEIKLSVDQSGGTKEKLFSRIYFKPISIAFLVAMFNQFSGINAILYYAPRIFELSGLSSADSLFQSILIGILNGVSTIFGLILIDRAGRKKLLIIGSIGMSVCLGLVAQTFYSQDFSQFGLLIYLLIYISFFGFSTGAVIWVLIAEIFPNRVRGKGQSLGSFTHWFFAALITFLFPVIEKISRAGVGSAFAFFSIMMIVQAIVVWKYFPETKGRTLEELGKSIEE
ncbi:MAG TPA: sugar porter family MFS transporter [Bacteroidales bacterium]|nr:sugar porter family MFS transporter [Bacteroidales bacterium]